MLAGDRAAVWAPPHRGSSRRPANLAIGQPPAKLGQAIGRVSLDWERVNVWTSTLYTLIHSLSIARAESFGDLSSVEDRVKEAGGWIIPDCSYSSKLTSHPLGHRRITFRRDPNKHFKNIVGQIIQMLIQDLVVILDGMMDDALIAHAESAGTFPQSKIEKLSKRLDPKYDWARQGCLELVAVRNVLTHGGGRWNAKSIAIVSSFVLPPPIPGERLTIGFTMLFRFRKAMRTFLNAQVRRTGGPRTQPAGR